MKNLFIASVLFLVNFSVVFAQYPQVMLDSIQTIVQDELDDSDSHGISLVLKTGVFGTRQMAFGESHPGTAMDTNMVVSIGSNTKLLISALILDLQEDGLLNIDDSLYQYLPEIPNVDSTIKIRQLLNHTSGINDYLTPEQPALDSINADHSRVWTSNEIYELIGAPDFVKGSQWGYSNTNYLLAGEIVKVVTGNSVSQELQSRVYDPAGTVLYYPGEIEVPGSLTQAHSWGAGVLFGVNGDLSGVEMTSGNSFAGSAGVVKAQPIEHANTIWALWKGQILNANSMTDLTTEVSTGTPSYYTKYGLGVFHFPNVDYNTYWHSGSWDALSAIGFDSTNNSLVGIYLNNTEKLPNMADYSGLMFKIFRIIKFYQDNVSITEIDSHTKSHLLFPNPNNGNVTINLEGKVSSTIYNLEGKAVFNSEKTTFDIGHLPSGVYVIKFNSENKQYSETFVLE